MKKKPMTALKGLISMPAKPVIIEEMNEVGTTDSEHAKSLEGTLSEWATKEDEQAYRDL